MHVRRALITAGFDRLYNAIVLVHDDAVAMSPSDQLGALVEAKMGLSKIVAYLWCV